MDAALYAAAFEAIHLVGLPAALPLGELHLALLQPSYEFRRADRRMSDVLRHELTVDGYRRQHVRNARIVKNETANVLTLDADDTDYGALGPGERLNGAVLLLGAGDDALLRAYFRLDRTGLTGGPVTVNWTDGHLLRFSEPPAKG